MIDFKKRLNQGASERKMNPVEIYDTIDRKSVTGPLRPAQKYILEKWYGECKEKRDLIIKLHTGEGKTFSAYLYYNPVLIQGMDLVYIFVQIDI